MRKLIISLVVLVLLTGALLLGAFLLPPTWRVSRSVTINAPPETIYPLVANFKTGWPKWSVFDKEDPDIDYSYFGPEEGEGAQRFWISEKMGNGMQSITQADPATGIQFALTMENGFALSGEILFQREGNTTKVTWTDFGGVRRNPLFRYMALLMEPMMGKKFEKSLEALKREAEGAKAS